MRGGKGGGGRRASGWRATRRGHSGPSAVVVMFYFLIWVLGTWVVHLFVKVIKLYTYDLCAFLYTCYSMVKLF